MCFYILTYNKKASCPQGQLLFRLAVKFYNIVKTGSHI